MPSAASLILFQENLGSVANNFIAAVPGHPVILDALTQVVNAINRGDTDTIWLLSGPGLLTRAVARFVAGQTKPGQLPPGMAVLDLQTLHQAVAEHCATGYKLKHKHWAIASFGRQKPAKVTA